MEIFYLNIRSIRNKTGEIEACFSDKYDFDVLCFTEHFLLESELDTLKINNFMVESYFCRDTSPHGGSIILAKPQLVCRERDDLTSISVENHIEIAAIEIKSLKSLIITIYRPPSGNIHIFLESMSILLTKLNENENTIINGDFNVHFNLKNKNVNDLLDLMRSFGFEGQVDMPTHKSNIIDNVFINFHNSNTTLNVKDHFLSDHRAIHLAVDILEKPRVPECVTYRPITKQGKYTMYNYLVDTDWSFALSGEISIEKKFNMFLGTFVEAINLPFPCKKKQVMSGTLK